MPGTEQGTLPERRTEAPGIELVPGERAVRLHARRRRTRWVYYRRRATILVMMIALIGAGIYGVGALLGGGAVPGSRTPSPSAGEEPMGSGTGVVAVGDLPEELVRPVNGPPPGIRAFAKVRGLVLYTPGLDIRSIGYHQAISELALPFEPLGRLARNQNRRNFTPPPASAGPEYIVLVNRFRGTAPTSAVDVAMPRDETVLAPVSGRVRTVSPYRLYDAWLDYRIEIATGNRPRRLVVVIVHVTDVAVKKGDRVQAGVTPIARPRVLEVKSDIERFAGKRIPHIHIEVKRA